MDKTSRIAKIFSRHEGVMLRPYKDSKGNLTIGIGRNVANRKEWISEATAYQMLEEDIHICVVDLLKIFPNFSRFSESRQIALISIRFQNGAGGFRGFKKMIKAIKADDWKEAKREAIDSQWYREFTNRAIEVTNLFDEDDDD